MMKKCLYVAIPCVYAAVIFYLSSLSNPPNPVNSAFLMQIYQKLAENNVEFLAIPFYFAYKSPDKFVHMILYMGFGFTLYPAVKETIGKYPSVTSVVIGTAYGVADEYHQTFVPYRSASATDLLADIFGLILSQVAIYLFLGIKKKR